MFPNISLSFLADLAYVFFLVDLSLVMEKVQIRSNGIVMILYNNHIK